MEFKNLCVKDNGADVFEFSSQYHHESRALNILLRDHTHVWFSSYYLPLPQHLTLKLNNVYKIRRVGVYLHGENNQNPKLIEFLLGKTFETLKVVKTAELEQRAGEHFFDLDEAVEAQFIRVNCIENFGGSGVCIAKIYAFCTPGNK